MAQLAAGLHALAPEQAGARDGAGAPGAAGFGRVGQAAAAGDDGQDVSRVATRDGSWHRTGLEEATDRWPR
jgi:hypothetical protein